MRFLPTFIRFGATTTILIALAIPAHAILDTNSNDLSDVWEKAYNNGTLPVPKLEAGDDPDQDGWNNGAECAAGTDPFVAEAPALRDSLTASPSAVPGIHYLNTPTRLGKAYQIQFTQDLATWHDQGTPYLGNGRQLEDIVQAVLGDGTPAPSVFWRMIINETDTDGDGLTDWEESQLETDPNAADTDGDGLSDLFEAERPTLYNPRKADTDDDGIRDGDGQGNLADTRPNINDADPLLTGSDPDRNSLTNPTTGQPMSGLRAHWTFEAATTTTPPSYPNTVAATWPLTGSTASIDDDGFISRSVRYSATGSTLSTSGTVFTGINAYTVSFWCKPDAGTLSTLPVGPGTVLAAFGSSSNLNTAYPSFVISTYGGTAARYLDIAHYTGITYETDAHYLLPSGRRLDDGNWHHIAVTRAAWGANGGNWRKVTLWLDGTPVATYNTLVPIYQDNGGAYFAIGRLHPTQVPATTMRGRFDRFAIFECCLTETEVTSLYHPDSDHDQLWDVTEANTRINSYATTGHPDPNANPPVTASLAGYALSPYYANNPAADHDEDGIDNLTEQIAGTKVTEPDSDGDGLPDGWENAHGLNPKTPWIPANGSIPAHPDTTDATNGPDNDGVNNLAEYLNGTNPANPNSDGDIAGDAAEIAQGSDPNDAGDDGQPPAVAAEDISFHVYGDYTQWEATITGKGPDDWRVRRFRMNAPGQATTQSLGLRPGNSYEFSLKYLSTLPDQNVPWYCWEAEIDNQLESAFVLKDHWLVDNSSGLLSPHTHSQGTNQIADKKVTLTPISLDVYPPEPTAADIAAAGDDNWEVETFQIAADEPEIWIPATVYVSGRDGDGNQTLIPAEDGTVVNWSIVTAESDAGGALSGNTSETENGMAAIKLTTSTAQKARFKVKAEVSTLRYRPSPLAAVTELSLPPGAVTTRTQFFEVVPGDAVAITAAQTRTTMPADGKSESRVTVTLKDSTGNFAARGTDVQWRLKGSGKLKIHDHVLASEDGIVEATVTAGSIIGQQILTIVADGTPLQIPIQNTAVSASLTAAYPSLDTHLLQTSQITLTTTGLADGAPVTWQASKGEIINADATVTGNSATATLLATATTTGEALVTATVGDAIPSCHVVFTSSAVVSASVENPVFAYDVSADGSESLPMATGSARAVAYHASTPVHISSPGHPGEWVTVGVSGSATVTAGRFAFDAETGGVTTSTDGLMSATLANGAAIVASTLPGASGSGVLDLPTATATATVPHYPALSLSSSSAVGLWFLPRATTGTLIQKPGEYRVFFAPDGRLSCAFGPAGSETTVTSGSVPAPGKWHRAVMSAASGRLTLQVDGTVSGTAWNGSFPSSTADLIIGGSEGMIDDLSINHRQPGLTGVTLVTQGLDAQNRIQLDAAGQATFVLGAAPAAGPPAPLSQTVAVEMQLAGQTAKVEDAAQVTRKGSAVLITAIGGHMTVVGTDTTVKDRKDVAATLLSNAVKAADRAGAIPKDLGGAAAERGEAGYLIALWMEEVVDEAGDIQHIIKISASGLPPEVGEVLNMMLAETVTKAASRGNTSYFSNHILYYNKELINALRVLSTGDIQSFARLAGVTDGEMGFDNLAATAQQIGEGPVTRLIKDVGLGGGVAYELLRQLAAHLGVELASGQEMSAAAKEIQRSLLAGLANGALGAKETLKDAAGILLQQGHITPEGVAAFGFVYGLVEYVKESGEDLVQPELMVEAIGGMLDLSFAAVQGDQRAIAELEGIVYSAAQAPVSMSAETARLWEEGEYFKAGSGSAKVVLVGLAAKQLKDQLQKTFLKLKHHRRIKGSQGALNNIVGEAGEAAAMIRISRKGNKKIVAMRNDSNQGIDYVFRDKKGHIVFAEVKAHEGGGMPRLSKDQKKSREFCERRLQKLTGKDNDPLYKNVPDELKQFAQDLLDEIDPKKGNKPFRAIVINVDNALSPNPIISYSEWLDGLGPTIPNP